MTDGADNLVWAGAFVDELVRAGVRWFVIAPGSRSTPLVLAADQHEGASTVVHLDERSAAFFALGIGKASGVPAAVITTSGTATANLLPAAVEAAQSESPLILLTADRPNRLLGGDANQAIDQHRLYGSYAKEFFSLGAVQADDEGVAYVRQIGSRAVAAAHRLPQGVVHVNAPFAKPLAPEGASAGSAPGGRAENSVFTQVLDGPRVATPRAVEELSELLSAARRPLVVAGPQAGGGTSGPAAERLSSDCGLPLVADPLSGARFGSRGLTIDHAALLLSDAAITRALLPDLIVRFGRSPTSPHATELCRTVADVGGSVAVIDAGAQWKDHRASVTHMVPGDPASTVAALVAGLSADLEFDPDWPERWSAAGTAASGALASAWSDERFEGAVARAALRAVPEGGVAFLSSSMPIRDVDAFTTAADFTGLALGNRGASGIDGITSTALGTALATKSPTLCLIGDVAFQHDLGGLLAARSIDTPVVFVVVNNDGGGIFHMLPIREHEPAFTEYFATPHGLSFRHAAALYDLHYETVELAELGAVVARAFEAGGVSILEVATDRARNREARLEYAALACAAARESLGL